MQRINLYHALPKVSKSELTPPLFIKICGGFLIFLLLLTLFQILHLFISKIHLAAINKQQIQFSKKIMEYTPIAADLALENEIAVLKKKQSNHQATFDLLLQYVQMQKKEKFSRYFLALSRDIVPNVWLRTINVSGQGSQITLTGTAIASDELVLFYQHLKKDRIFEHHVFKTFSIKPSLKRKGIIDFIISTEQEAATGTSHP